jgi:hypothetical protein
VQKNTLHSLGILIGALGAAAYSCSPSVDPGPGLGLATGGTGKGGSSATGGTTGAATGGSGPGSGASNSGGSSAGGSSNTSGGTISFDPDASTNTDGNTMVDPDASCGMSEASATLKQVNMFVMFDRSWSMTECGTGSSGMMFAGGDPRCMTGPSRWALTSAALTQFVQSPDAAGLAVALRFFPDDNPAPGCDGYPAGNTMFGGNPGGMGFGGQPGAMFGGTAGRTGGTAGRTGGGVAGSPATGAAGAGANCDANACSQPLVDLAPLTADPAPTDVQEQKLVTAIMNSAPPDVATLNPNPQTPTSAALQGAANWAVAYETAHPDERTVIILITDGEPAGCDTSAANISAIASKAYMSNMVSTYVIGLGGLNSTILNQIAQAGGTQMAYTVSDTANATTDLLAQLVAIKGQALKCNLDVPKSDMSGKQIDPNFINVDYQSGDTGMPTEVGLVSSADKCGTDQGWYFDNPTAPTQIMLCPATCDTVTKDTQAHVKIIVGCKQHIVTR